MTNISIKWSFCRKNFLPIVDVIGECEDKEGEDVAVQRALEFIDKASEFKGVPYQNLPGSSNSPITISFSIIFPSDKHVTSYLEWVKQMN